MRLKKEDEFLISRDVKNEFQKEKMALIAFRKQ